MAKTCNSCNVPRETIPYVAFEGNEARHERREKRYVFIIVLLIILLVLTNFGWILFESQFATVDEATETIFEDVAQNITNGNNTITGGDYYYGNSDSR